LFKNIIIYYLKHAKISVVAAKSWQNVQNLIIYARVSSDEN
jgi:hypothetical protein